MPAVAKPAADPAKPKKKKKTRKIKPRVLKLKGWFKTPEDWEEFDEWVKVNALPRKLPEPEPTIRKAVPIRKLKKRLKVLSKPALRPPTQCVDREVSCAARYATASRRIKELAFPRIRVTSCNEPCIKSATLKYKASENILWLAQPKIRPMTLCRDPYEISRGALKRKASDRTEELARPLKRRKLNDECVEREIECRNDSGMSEWMEFLAIPAYRRLMGQETEQAQKWREQIIEELEPRGKQAYEEQMRKREEERRREEEREREEQKRCEEEMKRQQIEEMKSLRSLKSQSIRSMKSQSVRSMKSQNQKVRLVCDKDNEEDEDEGNPDLDETMYEDAIGDEMSHEEDAKSKSVKTSEAPEEEEEQEEETEEDEEAKERRKKEKNAWRFEAIAGCKEFPPVISDAAKSYEASAKIQKLAEPKKYKNTTCKDPYKISEGAKSASASPATEALAKPKYTCEPVKRAPPREKDEWGMPIYPKPVCERVLPEPEPYPEAECKTEEEKEEERKQKEEEKKKEKKPIDKIAYEPTIDPMFDPRAAKRQARERERAAQEAEEEEENADGDDAKSTAETIGGKSTTGTVGRKSTAGTISGKSTTGTTQAGSDAEVEEEEQ